MTQLTLGDRSYEADISDERTVVLYGPPEHFSDRLPTDYVNEYLLSGDTRSIFIEFLERVGICVCRNRIIDPSFLKRYASVGEGGNRSQTRFAPSEIYHHDARAEQLKWDPRVLELHYPESDVARWSRTLAAPIENVVPAMFKVIEDEVSFQSSEKEKKLEYWIERFKTGTVEWTHGELLSAKESLSEWLKKHLNHEAIRRYFLKVDELVKPFGPPWTMNETRFFANRAGILHRRFWPTNNYPHHMENTYLQKRTFS